MNQVPLARPEWNHEEYFREQFKDVTILICQRKTRDLIQLCVTSILNHYPEINILVVDGDSQDESIEWLRFMSAKHPNIKVWERVGRNSHGETMHEAIMGHVKTKYVLLMDSDTIVRRGGFIEGMMEQFSWNHNNRTTSEKLLYATGSLMLQSIKGEACCQPENENDVLRYAHPSCSLYDVEIYKTLRQFTDHGAPCALNNIDAQNKGYLIDYFPVDKYVQHLCGASWQEVPTVWNNDGDIQVRPLVTFICYGFLAIPPGVKGQDYNIISIAPENHRKASTYDRGVLDFENGLFDVRFRISGHYIIEFTGQHLPSDFLYQVRKRVIEIMASQIQESTHLEFEIDGIKIYERKHWQKYHSMK